MVHQATSRKLMSVEDYLEFEKGSPARHEYVGGHVYVTVGVSRRHGRISLNIARKLADAADDGSGRVHQSDMKVPTPDSVFYYPDVVVACGPEPEDPYLEDEPCLIVEQDEARIEHHYRDERDEWRTGVVEEGAVSVGCPPNARLSLADVYRGL